MIPAIMFLIFHSSISFAFSSHDRIPVKDQVTHLEKTRFENVMKDT